MAVGVITGSGSYALLEGEPERHETPYGPAELTRGDYAGVEVLHVSRHGAGHVRLSNHVTHRANIWALRAAGATGVIGVTVCGAVDPGLELGSVVCFDDLHFVVNRLADGSICSFFDEPGGAGRGHWIFEQPFSAELRRALLDGARAAGIACRDGGCYGMVDGPRFNTKAEIRALAACGVTAVSQTAGPETVLCGELELPYALLGYATDYANGVHAEPTPVDTLMEFIARSPQTFAGVLEQALPRIDESVLEPVGTVFRF